MKKLFKYGKRMRDYRGSSCAVLTPRYEMETECLRNCSRKQGI